MTNAQSKRHCEKLPISLGMNVFNMAILSVILVIFIAFTVRFFRNPWSRYVASIPIVDNPKVAYRGDYPSGPQWRPIFISVDKNGTIYIQEKAVAPNAFYGEMQKIVMAERKQHPLTSIIMLNADKRVPMAKIYAVINTSKSFGIDGVGLLTSPP